MSISGQETSCENGDAMLIIVYRSEQDPSMTSLDTLKYNLTKNVKDWDHHFQKDCQIASSHADVIAYTNTPRNIGQMNISILWYIENKNVSNSVKVKHLTKKGHLKELLNDALAYLNTYIQPHHLISFSVFEEDHPNSDGTFNVAIMHKGSDSQPFERKGDIIGNIYELHLIDKH